MAIIFNLFKLVGMSHHICEPSRAYCLVYELILLSPFSYVINRLYQIQIKEGQSITQIMNRIFDLNCFIMMIYCPAFLSCVRGKMLRRKTPIISS